ncbi:rhamnulose-1-phosphate aldolase, partial [Enterobacter hormaechei]
MAGKQSPTRHFKSKNTMQTLSTSWVVQGMIKSTTQGWRNGWAERKGGQLTLPLEDADKHPNSP